MSNKKQELKNLLRAKIAEKKITRSNKTNKETVLYDTLGKLGINKEEFKKDLENIAKSGGLEIGIKK